MADTNPVVNKPSTTVSSSNMPSTPSKDQLEDASATSLSSALDNDLDIDQDFQDIMKGIDITDDDTSVDADLLQSLSTASTSTAIAYGVEQKVNISNTEELGKVWGITAQCFRDTFWNFQGPEGEMFKPRWEHYHDKYLKRNREMGITKREAGMTAVLESLAGGAERVFRLRGRERIVDSWAPVDKIGWLLFHMMHTFYENPDGHLAQTGMNISQAQTTC
jgi:hypothetical protein